MLYETENNHNTQQMEDIVKKKLSPRSHVLWTSIWFRHKIMIQWSENIISLTKSINKYDLEWMKQQMYFLKT